MRCAVINIQTNVVENVIELAENSVWQAPAGTYLVISPDAAKDYIYENGVFVNPNPPIEEEQPELPL